MIKLGEEQNEAISLIKGFINSERNVFSLGDFKGKDNATILKDVENSQRRVFSLQGYAGTGKSTIIKQISEYLEKLNIPYVLCAPTHKAKLVLEILTQREGMTLHKLLALSPNLEILNLDFNYLEFRANDRSMMFPTNGVIICDEGSMVSDDLFNLLLAKASKFNCKIIFSSDKAQLRPVNAIGHSKVFNVANGYTLKKIYRQVSDSGLVSVLPILRESIIHRFTDSVGLNGSLLCYNNTLDFFKTALPYFSKAIKKSDILETKFLSYTNNRVNALNGKIREILFDKNKEYCKHEFLTGNENLEFNDFKFWNSMDYVIIDEPKKVDITMPLFMTLPGYSLNLYDYSSKQAAEISILSKDISEDYLNSLAYTIDTIRSEAAELKLQKNKNSGKRWRDYYRLIESFTSPVDLYYDNRLIRKKSFDYGYAMTVHRS